MGRGIIVQLNTPVGVASGAAMPVKDLSEMWVQTNLAAGAGNFEGTLDGASWFTVAAIPGASGLTQIPQKLAFLRVTATADLMGSTFFLGAFTNLTI